MRDRCDAGKFRDLPAAPGLDQCQRLVHPVLRLPGPRSQGRFPDLRRGQATAGGDAVGRLLDAIDMIPDRHSLSKRGREERTTRIPTSSRSADSTRPRATTSSITARRTTPPFSIPRTCDRALRVGVLEKSAHPHAIVGLISSSATVRCRLYTRLGCESIAPLWPATPVWRAARRASGSVWNTFSRRRSSTMDTRPPNIGRTSFKAVHEAGHAVVAAAVGLDIATNV